MRPDETWVEHHMSTVAACCRGKASRFQLLLGAPGGVSGGAASWGPPCRATLREGADLELQQMVKAVFSL